MFRDLHEQIPAVHTTQSAALVPNIVPAVGTLCRCPHGVYIPSGETTAPYCTACTPGGPKDTREVVLPRSSGARLDEEGRTFANKRSDVGCPKCGSHVWMRVSETGDDTRRECADCGHKYCRTTAPAPQPEEIE